eukprot:g1164.t1
MEKNADENESGEVYVSAKEEEGGGEKIIKSALKKRTPYGREESGKKKNGHVRFGVVDVNEFDRQIYLDAHGAPKVRLGFKEQNHFRKRLGSWEDLRASSRRIGEELRTDLAELGRSLFLASNTVSIVRQTPTEDASSGAVNNSGHGNVSFAVSEDGMPVVGCEGFLWKKGTDVEKWKKRWFELKPNGLLVYYDKKEKPKRKMKGACVLSEKTQIIVLPDSHHGRNRCFQITNLDWKAHKLKKRSRYDLTLQVVTPSYVELEKWSNVFRSVRSHVYPDATDWIEVITSADQQLGIELRVHEDLALINRIFPHAPAQMRIICIGMRLVAINGVDMRHMTGRQVFQHLVALKGKEKCLAFAIPTEEDFHHSSSDSDEGGS